jgi:hypothetical protein
VGPIVVYDKSFLQSLSLDESVWFDHFFYPVTTPLFFVETLADLYKAPREGKTAEEEVAIIADKTPQMSGAPCYVHHELCMQDLIGNPVPLTGQIPIAGIRTAVRNGKVGAVVDEPEEAKAFRRWQRGEFQAVERNYARGWREQLARTDLSAIANAMKYAGVDPKTCNSLDIAVSMAGDAVRATTKSVGRFEAMLEVLRVPDDMRQPVKRRWKRLGHPFLFSFAPYAAYVLSIEVFFHLALGANLIASSRPSHRIDIAYLFYLPFCSVFVSTDRLHRTCAPLFLRPNQSFVWGADLKADLGRVNAHFSGLPEEVRQQGIYRFARQLPDDWRGAIRELYERHTPGLLRPPPEIPEDPEFHERIMNDVQAWENAVDHAPKAAADRGKYESLVLKRVVSPQRGSWTQVARETKVEEPGGDG